LPIWTIWVHHEGWDHEPSALDCFWASLSRIRTECTLILQDLQVLLVIHSQVVVRQGVWWDLWYIYWQNNIFKYNKKTKPVTSWRTLKKRVK
jgi:hypothetical protein